MDDSLTPESHRLLAGLALPAPYGARLEAARALALLETSDADVVRALVAARDSDPSYQVRQSAAEALQAPAHRAVLDHHPDLRSVAGAAAPQVLPSTPTGDKSRPSPVRPLFPWLSVWLWPRRTVRQIVNGNPRYGVAVIIILAGLVRGLGTAQGGGVGDTVELSTILVLAAVLGPLGWLVWVYVGAALLRWIGGWLGGEAEAEEVRAALAWTSVPTIYMLPAWLVMIGLFGADLFASAIPRLQASPLLALPLLSFGLLDLAVAFWSQVLLILGLAEVHRFSFWRGLGTWVLTVLLAGIPFLCLAVAR